MNTMKFIEKSCMLRILVLRIQEMLSNRLSKAETGYYIQVISTALASLEMIVATGSYHGRIISAEFGGRNKNWYRRVSEETLS